MIDEASLRELQRVIARRKEFASVELFNQDGEARRPADLGASIRCTVSQELQAVGYPPDVIWTATSPADATVSIDNPRAELAKLLSNLHARRTLPAEKPA